MDIAPTMPVAATAAAAGHPFDSGHGRAESGLVTATRATGVAGDCVYRYTREGFHLEIPAGVALSIRTENGRVIIDGAFSNDGAFPNSADAGGPTSAVPTQLLGVLRTQFRLTAEQKERIVSLFDSGMTNVTQIARVVGTTFHTASRYLAGAGRRVPERRSFVSEEQRERIVAIFDGGTTNAVQIGKMVGCSDQTVNKYLVLAGRKRVGVPRS